MTSVACQNCTTPLQLPDNWQIPAFTCPGCHAVNNAPFMQPVVTLAIPTVPRVVRYEDQFAPAPSRAWEPEPDARPIRRRSRRGVGFGTVAAYGYLLFAVAFFSIVAFLCYWRFLA